MVRKKRMKTSWRMFSENFARFQDLPDGVALALFDATGRKKRSDLRVKRSAVNTRNMTRVDDSDSVAKLLSVARLAIGTDIERRGLKLGLLTPMGKRIRGNTRVATIRRLRGNKDTDELLEQAETEHLRNEVERRARAEIAEAEYSVQDPESIIVPAYLSALIKRYGRDVVTEAVGGS